MNSPSPISVVKVLLVEDYAPIRAQLEQLVLTVPGATIVGTADNPDDALALIDTTHPDVVVVDLQLKSGTSGLTILESLHERALSAAAVVLSNLVYPQIRQACFDLGARYVLDKAAEAFRLREAILEIAAGKRPT